MTLARACDKVDCHVDPVSAAVSVEQDIECEDILDVRACSFAQGSSD